jgi:uncharacterized membrane protein
MTLLLSEDEQKQVVAAIREAEKATSGEVRVHVEAHCPEANVLDRAKQIFAKLNMHKTTLRNGVLFYVATDNQKFAVIGDSGIHSRVTNDFWNNIFDTVREHFAKRAFAEGLCKGIELTGQKLKLYFPYQSDDINELSDDISFG